MSLTDEQMIELLRRSYDAFNRRDYEMLTQMAHPDIVLARAGGMGELRGTEALRTWLEPDAFESQVVEPLEFRVAGNRVLVLLRSRVRGAGSGIEIEIAAWAIWTFGDDGLITRVEIFLEHEEDEALRALSPD